MAPAKLATVLHLARSTIARLLRRRSTAAWVGPGQAGDGGANGERAAPARRAAGRPHQRL